MDLYTCTSAYVYVLTSIANCQFSIAPCETANKWYSTTNLVLVRIMYSHLFS